MAVLGTVTISGGGSTAVISMTNTTYGVGLASGFQSLSAQFASSSGLFSYSTGSSFLAATNGIGNVAVFGPTESSSLLVGDGDTLGYFGSGNATILSGDGNDTISAGTGSDTISAGTGNNQIFLGSGANETVDSIGNDSIQAGSGADTVSVEGGASTTIYGGTGALTVSNLGAATINGGTSVVYGASGATTTLIGSGHNNVLVANGYDGNVSGGSVLFDGSQASGGNQFWAGSGNATLIGGSGSDTLVGGNGLSTLTGGAGSNDFDFFSNVGGSATNVTITDFGSSAGNVLNLDGYGSSGLMYALNHQSQTATGTTIGLNDGSTITLQGYKGSITSANVHYN